MSLEQLPVIALSTSCFQIQPDTDGEDLVTVIRDLPVSGVELDYRLPAPLYHQICPALRKAGIPVTSLHNFCPLPLEFLDTGGSGNAWKTDGIHGAGTRMIRVSGGNDGNRVFPYGLSNFPQQKQCFRFIAWPVQSDLNVIDSTGGGSQGG